MIRKSAGSKLTKEKLPEGSLVDTEVIHTEKGKVYLYFTGAVTAVTAMDLKFILAWAEKPESKLHTDSSKPPEVGNTIYIPSAIYLDHGEDDIQGGLAVVTHIVWSINSEDWEIVVEGIPNKYYCWFNYLSRNQDKWAKEYGQQEAKPDPSGCY